MANKPYYFRPSLLKRLLFRGLFFVAGISCRSGSFQQSKTSASPAIILSKPPDGTTGRFIQFTQNSSRPLKVDLPNLAKAATAQGMELSNIVKSISEVTPEDDSSAPSIRIELQKLTKQTCHLVAKVYADGWQSGLSGSKCDDPAFLAQEHTLKDFLTPAMQVGLGDLGIGSNFWSDINILEERDATPQEILTHLAPHQISVTGTKRDFSKAQFRTATWSNTNCWSTAFEVLRRSQETLDIMRIESKTLEGALLDSTVARSRSTGKVANISDWLKSYSAAFGDVLLVYDKISGGLTHAAVFVDSTLLFQKSSASVGFQLVTLDSMGYSAPEYTFEVYRTHKPLPSIADVPNERQFDVTFNDGGLITEVIAPSLSIQMFLEPAGGYDIDQSWKK
jgi:hypothetical protein